MTDMPKPEFPLGAFSFSGGAANDSGQPATGKTTNFEPVSHGFTNVKYPHYNGWKENSATVPAAEESAAWHKVEDLISPVAQEENPYVWHDVTNLIPDAEAAEAPVAHEEDEAPVAHKEASEAPVEEEIAQLAAGDEPAPAKPQPMSRVHNPLEWFCAQYSTADRQYTHMADETSLQDDGGFHSHAHLYANEPGKPPRAVAHISWEKSTLHAGATSRDMNDMVHLMLAMHKNSINVYDDKGQSLAHDSATLKEIAQIAKYARDNDMLKEHKDVPILINGMSLEDILNPPAPALAPVAAATEVPAPDNENDEPLRESLASSVRQRLQGLGR